MNEYLITIDVDWASDEMIDYVIDYLVDNNVKATWFITHDSPSVRKLFSYPDLFEIGIHPNFDENSTQGKSMDDIISNILEISGKDTKCVRTHRRIQSPSVLWSLKKFNMMYDSSVLLFKTPDIVPHKIYFNNGESLERIPYFWEDAEECKNGGNFNFYDSDYHVNGIKIFNFHPVHIFINSCSVDDYNNMRINKNKKGSNDFFKELVEFLKSRKTYKITELFSDDKPDIHPSSYVHPSVVIGKNVKIGPNCSIGYDGFSFKRDDDNVPIKVEHNGTVIIGDNVEIQADVCVVRGIKETIIGDNTKIDNLVHIAHDCKIGKNNLLAAGTVLSGWVTVGDNNFFGVNSSVKNRVVIGNNNLIGMGSVVIGDITDCEIWAGVPAKKLRDNQMFKKSKVIRMNDKEIENSVKKLFQKYYKEHGNNMKSLAWKSKEQNQRRFNVLNEIGIEIGDSILDVGCGFGDFVKTLVESSSYYPCFYFPHKYLGIDIVPEFIDRCKDIFFDTCVEFKSDFKCCTIFDINEEFDWVISAGAFGYKAVTDDYIKKTLKKAFALCRKGIAFNFTSTYVDYRDPLNHYVDPLELFDWARKNLSKYIVIRHDFLDYEFIIYIYKERNF